MNFLEFIAAQKSRLKNVDCVYQLYGNIIQDHGIDPEKILEFYLHIEPDQTYMETMLNLLNDESLEIGQFIPEDKAYLLTFLYMCMRNEEPCYTEVVRFYAAIIYAKLISYTNSRESYLKRKILLRTIALAIDRSDKIKLKEQLIDSLHEILLTDIDNADRKLLSLIPGTFIVVIMRNVDQVYRQFEGTGLLGKCFQYIVSILRRNNRREVIQASLLSLFNPFRKNLYLRTNYNNHDRALRTMRNFIRYLMENHFSDEQKEQFVPAFVKSWGFPDFSYFEDAIFMLNDLPFELYSEVVRHMGLCLMSKNHNTYHSTILRLVGPLFSHLPAYCDQAKLSVLYEVLLGYVIFHCHESSKCVRQAIEALAIICTIRNSTVRNIITTYANNELRKPVSIQQLLKYFLYSATTKWISGAMTVQVVNIVCAMLSCKTDVNVTFSYELIHALCWDSTPHALLPNLPALEELLLKLKTRKEVALSNQIMNIIIKMSRHPDATSKDFVKYLYDSMFNVKQINNITYNVEVFINAVMEHEENAILLFQQCQNYRLIERDQIEYAINTMNYNKDCQMKLLYYLVKNSKYNKVAKTCQYILANLKQLIGSENFNHILLVYHAILENTRNFTENELSEIETIYTNIMDAMKDRHVRLENIQNCYLILLKSRSILRIEDQTDFNNMNKKHLELLETCIANNSSDKSILYLGAEIILRSKQLPSENCISSIMDLTTYDNLLNVKLTKPDLWFPLFHLAEVLAIVKRANCHQRIVDVIHKSMYSAAYKHTHRMFMLQVLHSLATEITEDYEPLIKYSLIELRKGNKSLRKLASTYIEDMIERDYLKLTALQFFYFVSLLGNPELRIHMQDLLSQRYIHNQQKEISRFLISFIVYSNLFKHPRYVIEQFEIVKNIHSTLSDFKGVYVFLFKNLSFKYKLNVMVEANEFLVEYTNNDVKHSDSTIKVIDDLLQLYEISSYVENLRIVDALSKGIKFISHDITRKKEKVENINSEYSPAIIKILKTLMHLFFYNESEHKVVTLRKQLFNIIMMWIVSQTNYILEYIHKEGGEDLIKPMKKLVHFYNTHKNAIQEEVVF